MKKYEFTGEVKLWLGRTLHQIRATVAFGDVKAGDVGGWIEKEENLSQDGNAWVYGDAQVYGGARVSGNAWVCGDARVYGDAWVCKMSHYLTVGPIGSRNGFTTFFRTKSLEINVTCGCFRGNIEAFAKQVQETHGDNDHAKHYMMAVEMAKAKIDLSLEE